eukprot:m51a1_g12925 hypothetical protein (204) ;mRNA; f:1772-3069
MAARCSALLLSLSLTAFALVSVAVLSALSPEQTSIRGFAASNVSSESSDVSDRCSAIPQGSSHQRCAYVRATCAPLGLLDYLRFTFCTAGGAPWAAEATLALWLTVLFYAMAEIAESHSCPMLSSLSESLKMSPDLAGLTFLAFGNGGADVFSSFAAIVDGDFGITMGQLLGAGCLITTVVVGAIALVSPLQLKRFSFHRHRH